MTERTNDVIRTFDTKRFKDGRLQRILDTVAVEEPLDIRISYRFKDLRRVQSLALTMRTPGSDRELTAGLLLSEGIITGIQDLVDLRLLGSGPQNEIVADLADHVDVDAWRLNRDSIVNSSCGICGKRSRDAVALPEQRSDHHPFPVSESLLLSLPQLLAHHQAGFNQTGGLHAAALVDQAGQIGIAHEDIGRHNALDKVIGHRVLQGQLPLSDQLVFLSSRASFELVAKSAMAGASFLATVGGPSSLAIETARAYGMTLVGFLREERFNVYSGDWRIK